MDINQIKEKIYAKIDELPTLPEVVPQLIRLMEDSNSSASGVTELISRDPALAAKILKVANSAYYGFPQEISDLEHAVALLGFNMVKSLALSIGVIKSFPAKNSSAYFSQEGLWLHSIAAASIIRELEKRFIKGAPNESIFIIGLLHDIGKVVLDQFFHEKFQSALEYVNRNEDIKLHLAEREIIGIDHCRVAEALLSRWNFPEKIVKPITCQHDVELPEGVNKTDVVLLRIANSLAQELIPGKEGNPKPNYINKQDLDFLKIKNGDLNGFKDYLESKKNEIESMFKAMI